MTSPAISLRYALRRDRFDFDVALDAPLAGITGVFGASGAGKTTLLRCIAGLAKPESGLLVVDGETWQDEQAGVSRPPHARDIGYVFQEPRLFPHLDVRDNLHYGARRARSHHGPVAFDDVVELLGLGDLLDRAPATLSGGEAQRVAIGRALLRAPRFLLMDEPLAALDAPRRNEILPFLERLHAQAVIPVIYVSHNIEEICSLCDHLAVMAAGRIVASGELQAVLTGLDVPELGGEEAGSVIRGTVTGRDGRYELTRVRFSGGELLVPGLHGDAGTALRIRIRANDVSLCRQRPVQTTILNVFEVRIDAIEGDRGPSRLLRLCVGAERLLARITRRSCDELGLAEGDVVFAQLKAVAVRSR